MTLGLSGELGDFFYGWRLSGSEAGKGLRLNKLKRGQPFLLTVTFPVSQLPPREVCRSGLRRRCSWLRPAPEMNLGSTGGLPAGGATAPTKGTQERHTRHSCDCSRTKKKSSEAVGGSFSAAGGLLLLKPCSGTFLGFPTCPMKRPMPVPSAREPSGLVPMPWPKGSVSPPPSRPIERWQVTGSHSQSRRVTTVRGTQGLGLGAERAASWHLSPETDWHPGSAS